MVSLYDEIRTVLEQSQHHLGVSDGEIICVLGNMVCTAARESGISRKDFLRSMDLNFLQIPHHLISGSTLH
jgi:hypothetical protein